jgi:hypothetical protein
VNHRLFVSLHSAEVPVVIRLAEEAKVDEQWSYVVRRIGWVEERG